MNVYGETLKAIHDYTEAKEAVDHAREMWRSQLRYATTSSFRIEHGSVVWDTRSLEEIMRLPGVAESRQKYEEAQKALDALVQANSLPPAKTQPEDK